MKWYKIMIMRYQGINLENVKLSNRSSILRLLNNNGAMSRKDIAEAVGLTAASVTLICTELLEEGVIVELGEAEEQKRAGRKKILVDINHDYRSALCIAIESDETYISVTDLKGKVFCNFSMPTDKSMEPEVFLKSIADQCRKLLWENDILKDRIIGVAVTIPGRVDSEKGTSLNTYNIWTREVPVRDILAKELGFTVLVENNLKAYAQSEILFGRGREEENIFLLKWGPGVGSAIIINHQIYQGSSGGAAEIGHMTSGKDGKLCNCGCRGCLETQVSTHAIIADVMSAYENDKKSMPILNDWLLSGGKMTYRNTAEWGSLEDDSLKKIWQEKLDIIAHNVRNVMSIMDPDRVIVIGYMFDIPGVFDTFKEIYKEYDSSVASDFFVKSELSERFYHTEGLAVVLQELFF